MNTRTELFAATPIRGVLFDLDGTLADTAPDLGAAANAMRITRGQVPLPDALLRPWASHGARGLIGAAFGIGPDDAEFARLRDEFLATYQQSLCVRTVLFERMEHVLGAIEQSGLHWGVVTNKPARFTDPLMIALELHERARAIVSGDTTAHAKPHPLPITHAVELMKLQPHECIYVGDDERDIVAGRAAGLRTVAAAYGYCAKEDPVQWDADAVVHAPIELLDLIGLQRPTQKQFA